MPANITRDRRLWPGSQPATSTQGAADPGRTPAAPADLVRLTEAQHHRPWATPRYVRRLVSERRIPSYRPGRHVLVSLGDLDAYAAAGYRPADGGAA